MAYQSFWYKTSLPEEIVDIIIRDLKNNNADDSLNESSLVGGIVDHKRRKSKNAWLSTSHWIGGFLWYYIDKINQENFKYDIRGIDNDTIQYTQYSEGEFYNWHVDSNFSGLHESISTRSSFPDEESQKIYSNDFLKENTEHIRKLSFTVQLSDPDSYEGGEVQLIDEDGGMYTLPKERGSIILFDSRTRHRVRKVKKGVRKSLVGWCMGPRWK